MCLMRNRLGPRVYSLKAPHAFSGCRPLQATGTAKFREQWRPSLEDGHFWIYIHTKHFFKSLLKKKTQVDNIAWINTSDTPPRERGGRASQRSGSPPPLSNFCNMGHCVDDSPSLHVVQGPRVLSAMLMGDPCWSL